MSQGVGSCAAAPKVVHSSRENMIRRTKVFMTNFFSVLFVDEASKMLYGNLALRNPYNRIHPFPFNNTRMFLYLGCLVWAKPLADQAMDDFPHGAPSFVYSPTSIGAHLKGTLGEIFHHSLECYS